MTEKSSGDPLRLDLGCGRNKREGFVGVDKYETEQTDLVFDLLTYPWPWADNSVDELNVSHFFEHIPGLDRPRFMEEVYRVMKPGAKALFVVPYYKSPRAYQDFSHAWPPVCEQAFLYFSKAWREAPGNWLTHGVYDIKADFDFTYGYILDGATELKCEEAKAFALKHYWEAALDLHVTLIKRPA